MSIRIGARGGIELAVASIDYTVADQPRQFEAAARFPFRSQYDPTRIGALIERKGYALTKYGGTQHIDGRADHLCQRCIGYWLVA